MTSAPIPVVQFPPGPTKAMLTLSPRLRRMRGIRPWRPHAFLRVLLGGRLSPDGEVTARSLVHLLLEKQPCLRSAWETCQPWPLSAFELALAPSRRSGNDPACRE